MTQVFKCDICGELSNFDNNVMIGNKQDHFADICYECKDKVMDFIGDENREQQVIEKEPAVESPAVQLEKAISLVKGEGFVVYKPPATRNRKSLKKK